MSVLWINISAICINMIGVVLLLIYGSPLRNYINTKEEAVILNDFEDETDIAVRVARAKRSVALRWLAVIIISSASATQIFLTIIL